MRYINLTPHQINIQLETGEVITVDPSGDVARVEQDDVYQSKDDNGVSYYRTKYYELKGVPVSVPGVMYIVSGLVLSASGRTDLAAPSELIRDSEGRVIACRGLRLADPAR